MGAFVFREMPSLSRLWVGASLQGWGCIGARLGCASCYCIKIVVPMNPCPCGYYPDAMRCNCTDLEVKRYSGRVSGPLLDRIDLSVGVLRNSYEQIKSFRKEESSGEIRGRVMEARKRQRERNGPELFNSRIPVTHLKKFCILKAEAESVAERYYSSMDMSIRGYHRLLRVARTIADLDGAFMIGKKHILEAASYRSAL